MRACADTPVDAFFSEGAPSREIIDLCRGCDERVECGQGTLELANADDVGFRAGMTARARRMLRERRRKPAQPIAVIYGTCLECDRPLHLQFPDGGGGEVTALPICPCGTVHRLTVTLEVA